MQFPKFLKVVVFPKTKGTDIIYGIDIRITELLAQALKFSYEIVTPSDGEIGKPLPNGTWTGMIGVMQRKEADLLNGMFISEDRATVVDFCYPFHKFPVTFATQKPKYSPDPTSFLKPFSFGMWMSIMACFLLCPCILSLLLHKKYKIVSLILSAYSIFLENSISITVNRFRDRMLLLSWIIGVMFLGYGYKSVLLASLTFPPLNGVKTIQELSAAVVEGRYKCSSPPGSLMDQFLRKSSNPHHKVIGQNILENQGSVLNIDEALKKGKSSKGSAYISGLNNLLPYKERYFISDDEFYGGWKAASTQKNFCCKAMLDRVISNVCAAGLYKKIIEDVTFMHSIKNNLRADVVVETHERQISMEDMKGVFILLLVGLSLSTVVFVFEYIHGNIKKSMRRT